MSVKNPGSFNDFAEANPGIQERDRVAEYSGSLAAYHAGIAQSGVASLSPDFIILQGEATMPKGIGTEADVK